MSALSANTQAVLLLTSPLLGGGSGGESNGAGKDPILRPSEYEQLAQVLRQGNHQPADFLNGAREELLALAPFDPDRLRRLLARGFQLSQAVERWNNRSISVIGRADPPYPQRLKQRLKRNAPPLIYACGNLELLIEPVLAVVGSRHTPQAQLQKTQQLGELAAAAGIEIVSGGARGVDETAMLAALRGGGHCIGVLADSLEKVSARPVYREALIAGRLLLLSAGSPSAGFTVGRAMERNTFIYALADAALVIHCTEAEGGTWKGAQEQLQQLRCCPLYVLDDPGGNPGLAALQQLGACRWPEPSTPAALRLLLKDKPDDRPDVAPFADLRQPQEEVIVQASLLDGTRAPDPAEQHRGQDQQARTTAPAEQLQSFVNGLLLDCLDEPRSDAELSMLLQVSKSQVKAWLNASIAQGRIRKLSKPVRYEKA